MFYQTWPINISSYLDFQCSTAVCTYMRIMFWKPGLVWFLGLIGSGCIYKSCCGRLCSPNSSIVHGLLPQNKLFVESMLYKCFGSGAINFTQLYTGKEVHFLYNMDIVTIFIFVDSLLFWTVLLLITVRGNFCETQKGQSWRRGSVPDIFIQGHI